MINNASAAHAAAAVAPAQAGAAAAAAAAAVAVSCSSAVRFVAVPGSGLEEAFPRPDSHKSVDGTALPPNGPPKTFISAAADVSLSTESPSLSGITLGADGDGDGVRARTTSTSTQAPELKMTDWISTRSR